MECQHAHRIWFGSKLGVRFNNRKGDFIDWLVYNINNLSGKDLSYVAAVTYGIWYARNQQVFENKDIQDTVIIEQASKSMTENIS
jgi:hypothetical protein